MRFYIVALKHVNWRCIEIIEFLPFYVSYVGFLENFDKSGRGISAVCCLIGASAD